MENKINKALIGIDLGGTKVAAGRIDGSELSDLVYKLIPAKSDNAQDIINVIIDAVNEIFNDEVRGIGIGIPGLVDRDKGIVYDVQNIPSWNKIPLKEIMENQFNVPVFIDNDANCFALGEAKFGDGKDVDDFVGLTLGTGMGGGIIKNGTLMSDAHCGSGEFGNIPYLDTIYEDYCSGKFFIRTYGIKGEDIAKAASNNDPHAQKAFDEFGNHLGNAIKTIKLAVDPKKVIIGGSVAKAYKYFETSMWKSLLNFPLPMAMKNFEVIFSDVRNIAVLGAASLCFDKMESEVTQKEQVK
jgi:glucokinase